MKPRYKLIVLSGENPHAFIVKVKTKTFLAVYDVSAPSREEAIKRLYDPRYSKCSMSVRYAF